MRCLADTAGLLRRAEHKRVAAAMDQFSRRFPQLFVAIYTGAFQDVSELRQFGFWLLNRAVFEEVPLEKPNAAGILFAIDAQAKVAGVTFGYLLDPFLEEADTFDCLARAHSHWLEGRYADGMIKALEQLSWVLRKRSRQARRKPESFARKVLPPVRMGASARPLRGGQSLAAEAQSPNPWEVPR